MLIDAHQPEDVFARVPELVAQIDPVLQALDVLLEDDRLYQQVRADLGKRYRFTLVHGRHSTPVEVLLRMLLCKHLYQWSFKETEERVKDSLVLRWFCRVYFEQVPDETTLLRWFHTLRPETLHALNDRVVELARQAKVTQGRKLRLDATCVQTDIHHPTDSGLLVDSVRVLSRIVKRAKGLVMHQVSYLEQTCRSRLRSARTTAQTLHRQLRRKGEEKEAEQKQLYQKLIETAEQMVRQTTRVIGALGQQTEQQAKLLLTAAEALLPLVEQVIAQTRSRVLEGKKVASEKKVLSLFEPHTRAIPRHKGGAQVEFGRHVMLDEVEGGIVTRYEILDHRSRTWAGHRSRAAPPNGLRASPQPGFPPIVESIHLRRKPHSPPQASSAWRSRPQASAPRNATRWNTREPFGAAIGFSAGIEGRIASLRRDYGWRKSAYHGQEGMERWLGLGVIASNLHHIAQATTK